LLFVLGFVVGSCWFGGGMEASSRSLSDICSSINHLKGSVR
jgi:hypothetical protein